MPPKDTGRSLTLQFRVEQVIPRRNIMDTGTFVAAVKVGDIIVRGSRAGTLVDALRALLHKLSEPPYAGAPQDVDDAGLALEMAVNGGSVDSLFNFDAEPQKALEAATDEPAEAETRDEHIARLEQELLDLDEPSN